VNKITDVTNNAINYIYNEDNANGEYTLSRINYTDNSVRLTYESRNDIRTSYQAGSKLRQTKRLNKIITYINNKAIRTYNLDYQYSNTTPKRSQFQSVQQCVNDKCLPKTEFEWQYSSSNNSFDSGQQWQNDLGDDWKNHPIHEGGKHSTLIDMNGDGLPDRVFDRDPSNDQQGIYVFLNQSDKRKLRSITNGFGTQTIINYKPLIDDTVYYKGNSSYPNIDTQNARQVVSSVTTDNAIGGQNTTTYKYGGAQVNVKGAR
jgi:hypothetical protein